MRNFASNCESVKYRQDFNANLYKGYVRTALQINSGGLLYRLFEPNEIQNRTRSNPPVTWEGWDTFIKGANISPGFTKSEVQDIIKIYKDYLTKKTFMFTTEIKFALLGNPSDPNFAHDKRMSFADRITKTNKMYGAISYQINESLMRLM